MKKGILPAVLNAVVRGGAALLSAALLSAALGSVSLLGGCAGGGKPPKSKSQPYAGATLNVYNWGEYIADHVNDDFTRETGVKVTYTNFATNEEMYSKLKAGGVHYDVIFPSDYMISRMIGEHMLRKLDFGKIPNYGEIAPAYKGLAYDPKNEYSVPYMWGVVGIIYNKKEVSEKVDSWSILWNQKYKGQILMFDNSRDSIGIALKKLGYSYNTTDPKQLKQAADELKKQRPLVQAYVMDQIFDKMEGGEALLAPYYAGDAVTMMSENPDLAFAVPKEGTNVFVDAMAVPASSPKNGLAETYINYMTSAKISARNAEAIGYSTPSVKALGLLPGDIRGNKIIYPGKDVLGHAETYTNLPDNILKLYDQLWTEIIS